MTDAWHYVDKDNSKAGPVSGAELVKLREAGSITDHTLVWKDGMTEWASIANVKELKVTGGSNEPKDLSLDNKGDSIPSADTTPEKSAASSNILTQRLSGAEQGPESSQAFVSQSSGKGKLIMIILLVGIAAAAYFLKPYYQDHIPGLKESDPVPDGENMTIEEKKTAADSIVTKFENDALTIAREINQNMSDPAMVKKLSKNLEKVTNRYTTHSNALKLPCPTTKAAYEIPGYVAWAKKHEVRSRRVTDRINATIQGK